MGESIRLFPECHADTALIRFLVKDEDLLRHSAGINEVAKNMQRSIQEFKKVVGIVDNDKHKPRYFRSFYKTDEKNRICYLHKPESNEYLIFIDKAIESFLLWNASEVNLAVTNYGFPTEVKPLGDMLKRIEIETDPNYLQLLTELKNRNAPGFITLENILNDFLTT
ncbi:hypothetical protein [Larkinella rosea]|uniref:Uncharacterized protein n=1 Tax=Larkinella rosea TaxID=2025312 RepID=A0A3P1BG28_9BACT|nr:hypothetical protein [Larkinella rosea]RRB00077.1 hypothetical protein EHT25_25985 [Larkinella rosea]